MLKLMHQPGSRIVEIQIDGEVSSSEFDETIQSLEKIIRAHGKILLLKHVTLVGFPPIPLSKLWDDLKFGFEHLGDISHIAAVTDYPGVQQIVQFLDPLFKANMEYFPESDLEKARQWLREMESEEDQRGS